MFHAAKEMGLFEKQEWFNVIDSINVESSFLNSMSLQHHFNIYNTNTPQESITWVARSKLTLVAPA